MKIALIGPSYPFRGGIAHYTTLLFQHLSDRHQTKFFGFKRQYPQFLFPGVTDKDTSNSVLSVKKINYTIDSLQPLTWIRTARAIIAYQPDLVILPWWVVFWAPQFFIMTRIINRWRRKRVLFICHNVVEHESNRLKQKITRKVLSNGSYFLVHSDQEKNRLRYFFPNAVIGQAYMPTFAIIENGRVPEEKAKKTVRIDKPIILFFGFVRKYKGLDLLLKAMPKILAQVDVHLLIVGEFWQDKQEYLDLISQLKLKDHVTIVDKYIPNEEIGMYFSAANLLVMPYRSVTGSAVVQLSFSQGLPVLVSDIGALKEIVKEDKTGFLVPEGDIDAIAAKVVTYFKDNCESAFRAEIKKDRHRFSWENLMDTIENLVQENP